MFSVLETEYTALDGYPFAWRWTDRKRIEIPPEDLTRIRPLSGAKALEAWEYAKQFQGTGYWSDFQEVGEFSVGGRLNTREDTLVFDWLKKTLPDLNEARIFISWSENMAIETTQDVLIEYWDSFCFPVEDVVIWPQNELWVLLFDYKQNFFFAERRR